MKVLHVIPSYEPAWAFGGTVTATSQLCRALAKQGIDVTVYTTDANGKGGHLDVPLNKPVDIGGVKVNYFRCNLGVNKAFYSRDLSNKLEDTVKDFDLVHVSAIWQLIQVDVYKACKHFSKPYIVSAHGSFSPWPWKQKTFKKEIYWNLFAKKTVKNAQSIHFTTEDERIKSLATVPFLSKIPNYVVPNGIDLMKIKNRLSNSMSITTDTDKFLLLFVGRIHRKKGIHLVLEALKKIKNDRFRFMIIGNKEDSEYVNQLFKLSRELNERVIWKDQIPQDEIWDYYLNSNLFVLPSYDENFGMVVVEAMACGLPVLISKDVGIWREVEADNAGFVVNQDVDEIVNVFKNIIKDTKLLKQMSENAQKSAEKRYDIEKVASLMIKAYEDVLTGRKSPELQWM